jgi:hypothetical protein
MGKDSNEKDRISSDVNSVVDDTEEDSNGKQLQSPADLDKNKKSRRDDSAPPPPPKDERGSSEKRKKEKTSSSTTKKERSRQKKRSRSDGRVNNFGVSTYYVFFSRKKRPSFFLNDSKKKHMTATNFVLLLQIQEFILLFHQNLFFLIPFLATLYAFLRRQNNPTQTKQFKESNEVFLLSKKK